VPEHETYTSPQRTNPATHPDRVRVWDGSKRSEEVQLRMMFLSHKIQAEVRH
jgi:hypothetical protein